MIPPLGRRMRPPRRVAGLPALAPAPGLHHRPGRDLPVPALPTAGLAGRPGPYRALGRRRTDLHLQHRRRGPTPPPAETASPVAAQADPARPVHLDYASRPDLHHRPRHPAGLTDSPPDIQAA